MDITTDFGSVILGSSPGGGTKQTKNETYVSFFAFCEPESCRLRQTSPGRRSL